MMNGQRLILFGTGIDGERFYHNYKNRVRFSFVIDNFRNGASFHGLSCKRLDEVIWHRLDQKIIVAVAEQTYLMIRKELLALGLEEWRDFLWWPYYDKKIALFYGNCHIGALATYMNQNYSFTKEYVSRFFCVNEGIRMPYPTSKDIDHADIVITQDIREGNRVHAPSVEWIKKFSRGEQVIVVPNIWGINFLWPQMNEKHLTFVQRVRDRHIREDAIRIESQRSDDERNRIWHVAGGIINFHDAYLEEHISQPTEEIAKSIREEDIYEEERIRCLYETAIHKLKEREKHCDIIISDFIENNIKERQLFYDINHPHENLIFEMGRQICSLLHIDIQGEDFVRLDMDSTEQIIYGCVRKALNIKWKKERIRCVNPVYTMGNYGITLEEYIDTYKAWR